MPPDEPQPLPETPSEPLWCVVCHDRPRLDKTLICKREQCVRIYRLRCAPARACGVLCVFALVVGGIAMLFGYWLRGAL